MALHVSPPSCCPVYTQIRTHHRQPLVRHPRMPARRSGAHAQPWSACASASPCACRTDTSCSMSAGRRTCCGAMLCHMSAFSASAGMEARYQEVTSKREGYSSSQMTGADWSYQFHTVCMQHAAGHLACVIFRPHAQPGLASRARTARSLSWKTRSLPSRRPSRLPRA